MLRSIPVPGHVKERSRDVEKLKLNHVFEIRMNMLKREVGGCHEEDPQSGVMYISHLPHGFYKNEMWWFFSQFGRIKRIRMSLSKRTGNSRGYAFIEFEHSEVAKITADTMNNYLMFYKMLKCSFVPKEKLHPETFKNCFTRFNLHGGRSASIARHNTLLRGNPLRVKKSIKRLTKKERKTQKRLEAMGIGYKVQGYTDQWEEAKSKSAQAASLSLSDAEEVASSEEEEGNEREGIPVDKDRKESKTHEKIWTPMRGNRKGSKSSGDASSSPSDIKEVTPLKEEGEKGNERDDAPVEADYDESVTNGKRWTSRRKWRETPKRGMTKRGSVDEEDCKEDETPPGKNDTTTPSNADNSKTPHDETPVNSKVPKKKSKMNTGTPIKRRKLKTRQISKSTERKKSMKSRI